MTVCPRLLRLPQELLDILSGRSVVLAWLMVAGLRSPADGAQ